MKGHGVSYHAHLVGKKQLDRIVVALEQRSAGRAVTLDGGRIDVMGLNETVADFMSLDQCQFAATGADAELR